MTFYPFEIHCRLLVLLLLLLLVVVVAQGCLFLGRHYGRSFKEPAGIGAGAGAAHALVGGDTSVTRNSCTTGFDVEGGLGASKQSCLFRSLAVHFVSFAWQRRNTRALREETKDSGDEPTIRNEFLTRSCRLPSALLLLLPD